ncbi:hypothetical protein [Pseudoxanthomonas mexicana]|uniref:hypothetical protein n=1 Tax=Pseudoxanthomonas mexicana TaxID=128785 RepID=UPI0028A5D6A6|nr:hypothetical protein [Pseudoxanthomonas mexicana]
MKTAKPAEATSPATLPTFESLRELLLPYRESLQITHDEAGHFYANSARVDGKGKPVFFGAVKSSGKKTLFHFMPIYDFPELLTETSAKLKKHMQGKSCFNFTALDPVVLAELKSLVQRGVARYREAAKL